MMKMATGEGSPSGRVPEQGPDWFLVATEASGGGTPDLSCSLEVLGYMELYIGRRSTSGEPRGPHVERGRALGGWARPPPSWAAPVSFDVGSKSIMCVSFQNNLSN